MKNLFKKSVLILLCLTMVFSMVACGKTSTSSTLSDEILGVEIVGGDGESLDNSDTDSSTDDKDSTSQDSSKNGDSSKNENTSKNQGGSKNEVASKNEGSSKNEGGSKDDGREVVNNCYTTGYPIAKEKVTLKVMCVDYTGGADFSKMPFTRFVEQKFNVKLEFTTINVEDQQSKITLAYSSGTMPDMFWGTALSGEKHDQYAKEGLVLAIDKYLDKYMPNLKEVFKKEPTAKYGCTSSINGKTYYAPLVRKDDLTTPPLYINKTWLSKLGLSMPKTTNDLKNVLKAFKDNDPNGNGSKDEIPMAFVTDVPYGIYGMFGLSTYNSLTLNSAGKVVYPFVTDEYRKAITYLADLYSEKLLYNTEIRNFSAVKAKSMIESSVPRIGVIGTGEIGIGNYSSYMSAETFVKHYTAMPIIDGTGEGKATWGYLSAEQLYPSMGVITSNCKYPEIAARLLDYFYSEEGSIVADYGPPGEKLYWNYDKDGKPVYNNNKVSITTLTPGHAVPRYVREDKASFFTNEIQYKNETEATARKADAALKKELFKNVKIGLTGLTYTEDEKKQQATVSKDIFPTAVDWRFQFIYGKRNINSEWNNYVDVLNQLGVQTNVKIAQQAYDRQQKAIK